MARPNFDVTDALPRASILTYLRRPRPRPIRTAARPSSKRSSRTPLLPRIPEAGAENSDEEAQLGLRTDCDKPPVERDIEYEDEEDQSCEWGFYETLGLVCCALWMLVLVLKADVLLSRSGTWEDWSVYGVGTGASTGREIHFCLVTPNREAPSSRIWRFMQPNAFGDCATQIATLSVGPTEEWKLLPDDKILLEAMEDGKGGKSMSEGLDKAEELGDDLAEEGKLGRRTPSDLEMRARR